MPHYYYNYCSLLNSSTVGKSENEWEVNYLP